MKIFGFDITKTKAEEMNQGSLDRMSPVIVSPWERGRELYSPENYQQLIQSYKSWVYVCASKNSNAIAAAPLRLYVSKKTTSTKILVKSHIIDRKTEERLKGHGSLLPYLRKAAGGIQEIDDHPFLDMIKTVNPLINRFDLWDGTQLWLELTGNAFWYIYKNNVGMPVEIWPLPPQNVRIVASKEKIVAGYVYIKGASKIPFDADEIIHFKFQSPSGGLYGTGPLAAIMESYVDDQNIRVFESTLLKNMGRPEAVLQAKESISDEDFKRIKARWKQYAGNKKVGQTIILENGLTYTPITFTPREMNYVVGRKMNKEEIAAAFGVPMSKLTTEDVNRSNANSGNWQYQNDTIEPRLRRIEETINEKLMSMYDDSLFVAYDSTLPADRLYELQERTASLASYVTTVNEEREKMGLEPVAWGDIPLTPSGIAPLGSQPPAPPAPPAPPGIAPPVPDPNVAPVVDNNLDPSIDEPSKQLEELISKVLIRVKEKLANESV